MNRGIKVFFQSTWVLAKLKDHTYQFGFHLHEQFIWFNRNRADSGINVDQCDWSGPVVYRLSHGLSYIALNGCTFILTSESIDTSDFNADVFIPCHEQLTYEICRSAGHWDVIEVIEYSCS